jgi:hypothetical protein
MQPELHEWFARDIAVKSFDASGKAESLCDGDIVVLPKHVLFFITVGDRSTYSHVPFPTSICWRPKRLDYAPGDKFPWLPDAAHEVWGPKGEQLKEHHLFLRQPTDEQYFYAGPAHLGCAIPPNANDKTGDWGAYFTPDHRLPKDAWLHLGGFGGWLVEVNHKEHFVDLGDLKTIQNLLRELPTNEFGHIHITRYEGDSLTLHTNARRGWLMYQRDRSDSGQYTRDPDYTGDPNVEEVFLCDCGIDLEFAAVNTLPRDRAIEVVEEFFTTGELPRSVAWQGPETSRY